MKTFDNSGFEQYKTETKEKWGSTHAYKEHTEKTKGYSKEIWDNLGAGMESIIKEFSVSMQNGAKPDSKDSQSLVAKLQNYITENFYTCTNEILAGLGQMYVLDERFKNNMDKYADGTAEFISNAIKVYCDK